MGVPKTKQVYDGPPIHTVTIFANPFLDNKPSLDDEGVLQVTPGEMPPEEGSWHTLHFLPGLHDIGHSFTVHQDKSYYIPGDAVSMALWATWTGERRRMLQSLDMGPCQGKNCPIQVSQIYQRMNIGDTGH